MLAALLLLGLVPMAFWPDSDDGTDDSQDDMSTEAVADVSGIDADSAADDEDAPPDDPVWLEPQIGTHALDDFAPEEDEVILDFTNTGLPETLSLSEVAEGDEITALHLGFDEGEMTLTFPGLVSVPTDVVSFYFGPGDGVDSVTVTELLASAEVEPDSPGLDPVDPDTPDPAPGAVETAAALDPVDPDGPDATEDEALDPVDPGQTAPLDTVDPDAPDPVAPGSDPADPGLDPADPDTPGDPAQAVQLVELNANGLTEPATVDGFDPAQERLLIEIENADGHVFEVSIRPDAWGEDGLILLDGQVSVIVEGVPGIDASHVQIAYL